MALNIKYVGIAARIYPAEARKATNNLIFIIQRLPVQEHILLLKLNPEFEFYASRELGAEVLEDSGVIRLNLYDFTACKFSVADRVAAKWRDFAYAHVREEILHLFDILTGFSQQNQWLEAASKELEVLTPQAIQLMKSFRETSTIKGWQKIPISEYPAAERSDELIVEILLCKELLLKTNPAETVDNILRSAFPNTYPLAMEFEKVIAKESQKSEMGREPAELDQKQWLSMVKKSRSHLTLQI